MAKSWGGLNEVDDKRFNDWYDKYVPASGNCKTLGGEIIRAISMLVYRYYNDGDTVDFYYGSDYNSCRGADIFLRKYVPKFVTLENVDTFEYEEEVDNRLKFIHDYLLKNPQLFETPNEDDYLNYQTYEPFNEDEDFDEDEDW